MGEPGADAGILLAAMLAPTPLPQSSVTPRSTSPAATDLPKGMTKSG
jgi:hypothetical protein